MCTGRSEGLQDTTKSICQYGGASSGVQTNLVHHVLERIRAIDGEAYEEKVGLRI